MDETQHTPVPEALISERTLEHIRNLRLIDDLFMRLCFAHDKTCAQLVLRVVLNRPDLVLVSVETQHTVQGLPGRRSLTVDVYAVDSENRVYNLEAQRKSVEAERYRLHAAMLDASELEAGEDFSALPELHVIFIMERDPFKRGLPLYHFVRYMPEIGLPLNDGVHIVCVNGEIQGEGTELAKVMHDMFCADPEEMLVEELARVARHFKQTPEGVRKMSSVVEAIREEGRIEGWEEGREEGRIEGWEEGREEGLAKGKVEGRVEEKTEIALHMLRMGRFTMADIAEITRMSLGEVRALAAAHAPDARESAIRAEAERAEKTATILQLMKMGGFTLESIAQITRLNVDEVREIVARNAG